MVIFLNIAVSYIYNNAEASIPYWACVARAHCTLRLSLVPRTIQIVQVLLAECHKERKLVLRLHHSCLLRELAIDTSHDISHVKCYLDSHNRDSCDRFWPAIQTIKHFQVLFCERTCRNVLLAAYVYDWASISIDKRNSITPGASLIISCTHYIIERPESMPTLLIPSCGSYWMLVTKPLNTTTECQKYQESLA